MREILEEYGSTVLSAAAAAAFWILAGKILLSDYGLIRTIISTWGFGILE